MQILIDLLEGVFQIHLSQYLTFNDVVILDKACLSHEHRSSLLSKIEGMVLTADDAVMSKDLFYG